MRLKHQLQRGDIVRRMSLRKGLRVIYMASDATSRRNSVDNKVHSAETLSLMGLISKTPSLPDTCVSISCKLTHINKPKLDCGCGGRDAITLTMSESASVPFSPKKFPDVPVSFNKLHIQLNLGMMGQALSLIN